MNSVAPFPSGRSTVLQARPFRESRPRQVTPDAGRHLRLVSEVLTEPHASRDPSGTCRPAVRLTRRGRLAVFIVSCLALFGIVLASGAAADAAVGLRIAPATATVVVQPGESLWSIARVLAPGEDPRGMVHRIQELNGIGDWPIVPGQRLVVPASAGGS